jgi:AraC-like DNA-binding protein
LTGTEYNFSKTCFKSPETVDYAWLGWFRDEYSTRMHQADVDINNDTPFWLHATARLLPDLAFYDGGTSPMSWTKNGNAESFGMSITLAGEHVYKTGNTDVLVGPGGAVIGGLPDALVTHTNCRQFGVKFSPRLLAPLVPNFADMPLISLPAHTQAVRLLASYLKLLDAEEVIETSEAQYLAALHVHDLAALAIGSSRDAMVAAAERGGRAARLAVVKQDILAHLTDPNLSVATLAARQRLSPRYIHMLFEQEGMTYSEFVVTERLTRAHRMLADPRTGAHTIGDIALHVGFGDLSYFNRTFRRKYGVTPSDVRAMARADDAEAQG